MQRVRTRSQGPHLNPKSSQSTRGGARAAKRTCVDGQVALGAAMAAATEQKCVQSVLRLGCIARPFERSNHFFDEAGFFHDSANDVGARFISIERVDEDHKTALPSAPTALDGFFELFENRQCARLARKKGRWS